MIVILDDVCGAIELNHSVGHDESHWDYFQLGNIYTLGVSAEDKPRDSYERDNMC